MKYGVRFVLFTLLLQFAYFGQMGGALQASPSAQEDSPLALTLSIPERKVEIGAPILVTITLTNTSKADVVWQSERPDPAYRNFWFSLQASDSSDLPTTVYHRKIRGKQLPGDPPDVDSGSSTFATLSPGQSAQFTIDVRKIYKIEKPGIYKLVVGRYDELNKIKVHSKLLEIEVAP